MKKNSSRNDPYGEPLPNNSPYVKPCDPCEGLGYFTSRDWREWFQRDDGSPPPACPKKKICRDCNGKGFQLNATGKEFCAFLEAMYPILNQS